MLSLPIAFSSAIGVFAPVFSRPVWQHVKVLMTGAVLAPGQRTVTAILRRLIVDSRVVIGQVWCKRLFLQALHGGRGRWGIFEKSRLISIG